MRAMYVIQGLPETTDRTDESRDRLEGVMERESSHPAAMTKAYPPACPAAVTRAPPLLYPAAATGEDDPRRLDRRCSRRAGDQGGGSDWARAPVRQLRAPASPPASSPSLCCPGQLLVAMDRPAPGLLTPRWACRKEPDEPSAVTGVKPSALPPTPPPRLRVPAFPDKLGEGLSVPIPEEAGLGGRAAGETPKRAVAGEAGEKGLLSASASEAASAAAAASPRAAGA
mmetsp:Transcript_20461/g.61601  ORF Transcript_20461/g.61601 Transcript_20461/m.61601 type:complete len:227 (+) Transcript_20461:825-1505(+)